MNSCIHSGTSSGLSFNTVWYNYTTASAGTIINKNSTDNTGNFNTSAENICPSGWSLPSTKQIDSNKNAADFNPIFGGFYSNGDLARESAYGYWWGSEPYNGARRYYMGFGGSNLYSSSGARFNGVYIRCASEEKTVTDLTYMQDITSARNKRVQDMI